MSDELPKILRQMEVQCYTILKAIMEYRIEPDERRRDQACLLYTSPSPRDRQKSRMPSSA